MIGLVLAASLAATPVDSAGVRADTLAVPAASPALRLADRDTLGESPDGRGRLLEPSGIATDAFGRLYVTDAAEHRLQRWDAAGRWLDETGALGSEVNQFRRPGSVARLGSLGVAVLDIENRRILTFDLLGRRLSVLVDLASDELATSVGRITPIALASDQGGALYVADADGDRILAFDFSGHYTRTIGRHGDSQGAFRGLAGLTVGPRGELVTSERPRPEPRKSAAPAGANTARVRLQYFDAGGRPLAQAFSPRTPGTAAFPVAVDDSGRVALADESAGRLMILDRGGASLASRDGFAQPRALAFAPDGTLLVAEAGAGRVRRIALLPAAAKE